MTTSSQQDAQVYKTPPQDFSPTIQVAASYIEHNGKFLFLKRALEKPQGGFWGVPAGKLEKGEASLEAACRETFEETHITLAPNHLHFTGRLYIRRPNLDFIYDMYHIEMHTKPSIQLNSEHEEYCWCSPEEALDLPVMSAGLETLYHLQSFIHRRDLPRVPFYFIRHGETGANPNPAKKHVDDDLPLNSQGKSQALQALPLIKRLSLASVCYSPVLRAVETKDLLVSSLKLEQVEMADLGECKAHTWTKLTQPENRKNPASVIEVERFIARTMRGVYTALQKKSPTLLVSHGGVHRVLCEQLAIENHPWDIGNCQLVLFQPVNEQAWQASIIENARTKVQ